MEDKTFLVYEDETGQVEVRDEMITKIAGLAAISVDGVDSLQGNITAELISKIGRKNLASGVEIVENGEALDVYVVIVVEMGCNIPEVCKKVQQKVKSDVEDMLGIEISQVNIRVANVKVEK